MKIKFKFTLIITLTIVLLGISLNISVRKILKDNMESTVTSSLKEIMKSTRESVKYTLSVRNYLYKDKALSQESKYLIEYISINYDSNLQICDIDGNVLASNLEKANPEFTENLTDIKSGKTIVDIKYNNQNLIGMLSYPIIINESYIGIINLTKDYTYLYSDYMKATSILTLIEISLIIFIFAISYRLTNKIVSPIEKLTSASKELSVGNYDINIDINAKKNDEISILSREFINMKSKIQEQILDIEKEKEKVEKLALSRKIFFDTVTHELKTPLTSIIGYSEMILENVVDDEEFKYRAIDRIHSESERLNTLVLEIIKISKGLSSIKDTYEYTEISKIINQTISDLSIKAEKYNLKLNSNISKETVHFKPNKIKEVLINVLDNAIKYSSKDSIITISSYTSDDKYTIEITNFVENPIPEYVYNHIFEPFTKSNSSNDEYSTGLGLYLCNEIIKDHNGSISIVNGNEIKVKLTLPLENNSNLS
ncbi:sensor histidine kinase [Clostridium sp.]|uniref:sensor histidine kinase n=1 Tax=Clostridium sp. TaxID=1506 RepID=UPI00115AF198|nr:HAMP domain-containing sensor histidine kinase [Clostridium sp.]MBS5308248.1 HAMP domain-containing histidine kinase [Clostridium sp.]MDU3408607.1 HAMP domain-containing sensor histidine kinase [Clostridium sp.]MDU3526617.1 HAMP domain-containing sensor histidine kinase [Clostridium sp.]MDU6364948.1 HAMP domain-containing sensor histidine kinase [Clostridium sp.]